jgi:Ni/Fe-hydrogenase subunit HybB-like protein
LAAGGVMMVIPAYLYHDDEMHDVVIVGELLAVASIIVCLLFVVVDLGRPDRFWHILPLHRPLQLAHLHAHLGRDRAERLPAHQSPHLRLPPLRSVPGGASQSSLVQAVRLPLDRLGHFHPHGHRVPLLRTRGAPLWNSAVLAPRFLASAFVSGPAFIVLTMMLLERVAGVELGRGPRRTLVSVIRVTCLLNLFLLGCELFTEFYTGGAHTSSARYLFLGAGEARGLVPWIWSAIAFNTIAAALFLCPATSRRDGLLAGACVLTIAGVWIEKGMGLIVPGFVPSTLHEIVEYAPGVVEWKVTVGIWAIGLLAYTVALKFALAVLAERMSLRPPAPSAASSTTS